MIRVEAARPRLPGALRPVERPLGELEERVGVVGVDRVDGDPGRAGELGSGGREPGDRGPHPLGDLLRVVRVGARQDQGEFLAARPGRGVPAADRVAELGAHALEHPVPEGMPMALVDRLEVVEVEGDQGDGGPAPAAAFCSSLAQGLLEPAVVREAGERVGLREVAQLRLLAVEERPSAPRVSAMPDAALKIAQRPVAPGDREPEDRAPEQGEADGGPGHHPAVGTAG